MRSTPPNGRAETASFSPLSDNRAMSGRSPRESLPEELAQVPDDRARGQPVLARIPEPWRARVTGRRIRRWLDATRANARHNSTQAPDAVALNFFPMRPQGGAPISEIVRELRMRIAYTPSEDEPTMAWDGDTWFSPRSARRLPSNAINGRCLDISKSRVHEAWQLVSGRSLAVDPLTATGTLVEKPEENGRHGGRLVQGPLSKPRRGSVYERFIDTSNAGYVTQTRPVLIGSTIVVAYEKWRRREDTFYGTLLSLVREPDALYSAEEQRLLVALAREMNVDYGEFDVIRDPASGLIEVVDVNRTPSRPWRLPPGSGVNDGLWKRQAEAFRELLLRPRGF